MSTTLTYVGGASTGGEKIHAMYAQSILWPAGTYQATTTGDDGGTKTFSFAGKYYRVYLAQSSDTGTGDLDAAELIAEVQSALGASWELSLRTDGYVQITYVGSGVGGITWGTSQAVATVLGFTAATVDLVENETLRAPYPPMGVMYSVSIDSTDWTSTPTDTAYAMTAGGIVYGWGGGSDIITKSVSLGFQPRTWADRGDCPYTPMWPADDQPTRRRTPTGPVGVAQPWSCSEFMGTSRGKAIAVVFSNFQLFGTGRTYEIGYQTPESIALPKAIVPPIKDYRQRSRRPNFELVLRTSYPLA